MTQLTLLGAPGEPSDDGSPFDKIRRERPDGSEYWSARELMPLLGYEQWRRFEDAVERAKVACDNSGTESARHFADAGKISDLGYRVTDIDLTRYGAYLVAMNGDPRKPEIAAAQTYFAIKTREAETRSPRQLTNRELASMVIEEADRADRAEVSLAVADRRHELNAHKVETFDDFLDSGGRLTLLQFSKTPGMLGIHKLTAFMTNLGMLRQDGLPMQSEKDARRLVGNVRGEVEITGKGMVYVRQRVIEANRQGRL